ncbi:hypothetical protein ACHAP5_006460 [Fusarium lateritium]
MVASPTPTSPQSPGRNTPTQKGPANRACDRCRRRKARCDFVDSGDRCTSCRESGTQCTFDLPIARRGPKSRTRKSQSHAEASSTAELAAPASASSSARWDSNAVDLGLSPPLMVSFSGAGILELWPETTFTLITAVCAEAAFLLPKDLFPEGQSVADIFLNASRTCLNQYLEAELENPNANSITIRYFHSNCLHAAGKPKYSWHIFGEATRLAQVMQLNLETSLEGLQPVEAELRRRAFWIVYMGDKSAAILNNRPITIHKFSFESGITTAYPSGIEDEAPVLSPGNLVTNSEVVRITCIEGFNANLRLWQNASDLLLELRLIQDRSQQDLGISSLQPLISAQEKDQLDALYVRFITCLDDLPPYLQSYTFAALADGSRETTKQFLIQCANLQVSIHCLRMVITQKLENLPYYKSEIGHSDLRKTEIARDMLRVIQEAPFWSLQVNGEPYVEKIRLTGASLLEIIHRNGSSPIAARARSDFAVLLDLLTRLDSKASDALRNTSAMVP